MIVKLIFIAAVLAAIKGNEDESSRQGALNNYNLFHRNPTTGAVVQVATNGAVADALNENWPTVVIIHGHGGTGSSTLNPWVTQAFLKKNRDLNVIVVDWSDYTLGSYTLASDAVQSVGFSLGQYLKAIIEAPAPEPDPDTDPDPDAGPDPDPDAGPDPDPDAGPDPNPSAGPPQRGGAQRQSARTNKITVERLHLVGFGLGAHVAGYSARQLGGVARVTGLSPSGSGWVNNPNRLSKTDAVYVEVIHTDSDGLLANGIGTPIGDVDFFVNGGSSQPGCLTHACCHTRAWELFAATLERETPIYGHLCRSTLQLKLNTCNSGVRVELGGDALTKPHGSENLYRANTGRTFPY